MTPLASGASLRFMTVAPRQRLQHRQATCTQHKGQSDRLPNMLSRSSSRVLRGNEVRDRDGSLGVEEERKGGRYPGKIKQTGSCVGLAVSSPGKRKLNLC